MGILNFIIVVLFNVYWASKYDFQTYLDAYKWKESGWLSIALWAYATLGIVSLIYAFI